MEIKRGFNNLDKAWLPDEQVEWKGRPAPFPLMTEDSRKSILLQWVLCVVACVAVTAAYVAVAINAQVGIHPIVELVIIAACIFVAVTPLRDRYELQKKVSYYVTNKRVILVSGDNFYALNRNGIKVEVRKGAGGTINLLFGSCVKMPPHKWRRAASLPEIDDEDLSKNGFVFYNIQQDKSYLERLMFKNSAAA